MISLDDYPMLNHPTTMKAASYDDDNKEYLTDSCPGDIDYASIRVINFDKVRGEYWSLLKQADKNSGSPQITNETPLSNDALFLTAQDILVFVEFKNGKLGFISKRTNKFIDDWDAKFDLHAKVYDSVAILTDIIEKTVSYTREYVEYVLVYNEEKNSYKEKISSYFEDKATVPKVRFGLERFKGYLLKDVHTYTPSQFEAYMKKYTQPTA